MKSKLTMRKLASAIAKKEGKKSQTSIGNIREILSILSDMVYNSEGHEVDTALFVNGQKRAAKNKCKLCK